MNLCSLPDHSPVRGILPFCLLLLLIAVTSPASQVFRYREQTGDDSFTFVWRAEQERGGETVAVTQNQGDEIYRSINTADGATLSWHYTRHPMTDVRAERVGNAIHFSGRFEGKEVSRSEAIDTRPWYQPLSYSLQRMMAREQKSVTFWTVRPDTLETLAMQAEKETSEEIAVDGAAPQDADKVVIRLDGLMAHLWQAEYWFRRSDNLFVRYQGTHGPPGTAATRIHLITP